MPAIIRAHITGSAPPMFCRLPRPLSSVPLIDIFSEEKSFVRAVLYTAQQSLGERSELTLILRAVLARGLSSDPARSRADVLEAQALLVSAVETSHHALGPRHHLTLSITKELGQTRRILAELTESQTPTPDA